MTEQVWGLGRHCPSHAGCLENGAASRHPIASPHRVTPSRHPIAGQGGAGLSLSLRHLGALALALIYTCRSLSISLLILFTLRSESEPAQLILQ